jgi:hypothetical protein
VSGRVGDSANGGAADEVGEGAVGSGARASGPPPDSTRGRRVASLVWALVVFVPPMVLVWPWLVDASTYGFHDWDVMTSHRFLAVEALRRFGELPAWNPYACGGFPAWGYVEGATIVVSPWLPLYLGLDVRWALRLEVLGMAIVGSAGSYALAGHFARSFAARALVVALFAVNGRFGLQAASGHAWHLAYALLPWCWLYVERALSAERRPSDLLYASAGFAWIVYAGGIYPLPHAALVIGVVCTLRALRTRSFEPIGVLAAVGALAVAWSAPKLLPMLATFRRAPRLVDSTETLSLEALWVLLSSRAQAFYDRPAAVSPYGWHEWGMYVSIPGALLLGLGWLASGWRRKGRDLELACLGALLVVLGFGAFHPLAPWSLLHEHVPVFRSQHVPSRFLYPAALVLALCAARLVDGALRHVGRRHRWAGPLALALVFGLALDVASVAQKPMRDAMWMRAPEPIDRREHFAHRRQPPLHYVVRDWAGPLYLAMRSNQGVLDCYGTPPFEGRGALALEDPRYRGEVQVRAGSALAEGASARLERWSHASAEVHVDGAPPGARLVYNMNADPGWTAELDAGTGSRQIEVMRDRDRVAVRLPEGSSTIVLRYRPPGLGWGLVLFGLGTLGAFTWWWRVKHHGVGAPT